VSLPEHVGPIEWDNVTLAPGAIMDLTTLLHNLPAAREALRRRSAVLADLVRGVARGYYPGLYLFGRPGTGKTYTVLRTLRASNRPVCYHKGHITPMGLFELLADCPAGVAVLDDVAELFASPVARQILLAALGRPCEGGSGRPEANARLITYKRQGAEQKVVFTGGVVAISNLELHDAGLLGAIRSRADPLNYDPTDEELAALMLDLAANGYTLGRVAAVEGAGRAALTPDECREVALFLIETSRREGRRLDLRVFLDKALPKRLQYENGDAGTHWKDLLRAGLEERPAEPTHASQPGRGSPRRKQKAREHQLVRQLAASSRPREWQLAEWRRLTEKSDRAFYRRLGEID
jgi:hypothetical protein